MTDIHNMVETTIKIAQDREFRAHNTIKGGCMAVWCTASRLWRGV
jgi:hypothetical protein